MANKAARTVDGRSQVAKRGDEHSLASEVADLRTLQQVTTELISESQPDALYAKLLAAAMTLMRSDAASLQLLEPGDTALQLLASRNFHPQSEAHWRHVRVGSATSCGQAMEQRKRIIVPDVDGWELTDPLELAEYRRSGLRAFQSTPLIARDGSLVGIISTHWRDVYETADRDFMLFDDLARQAAHLVDRTRAEAALRESEAALHEKEARQAFLLELSDALRPITDPEEVQTVAINLVGVHLGLDRCGYGEIDAAGEFISLLRDYRAPGINSLTARLRLDDFGKSVIDVLRAGHTLVIDDAALDPRLVGPLLGPAFAAVQVAAAISVPLIKAGRFVAALFAHQSHARTWTESDIALIEEVAERTWAAVERARAEAVSRESEARYRRLFNAMDEGFVVCTFERSPSGEPVDFRMSEPNPPFERLTGLKIEDVVGRRITEVFPPDEAQYFIEAYGAVVESGTPARVERYVQKLDRWFRLHVTPLGEDRVAVLYENVTDQKRAEAAVRDNEAKQAFLLTLSDTLRPLGDPEMVQSTAMRLLGLQLRVDRAFYVEVAVDGNLFQPGLGYVDGVAPMPDRLRLSDFGAHAIGDLQAGRTLVITDVLADDRFTAEREAYASIELRAGIAMPLLKDGRLIAILGLHQSDPRDWTESDLALAEAVAERTWAAVERARAEAALRDSEHRQRLALDAAAMGSFIWYPQEDRGEPDAQMLALFGLPPDSALNLTMAMSTLIHPDDRERYFAAAARSIDPARSGELQEEIRVTHPDGQERWVVVTGRTTFGGEPPQPLRLAGVTQDITERKHREANLVFLAEVSQELVRLTNVEATMNALGAKIGAYFYASVCAFGEVDEEQQLVTVTHEWKRADVPSVKGAHRISDFHTQALRRTSRLGETYVVRDAANDVRTDAGQMAALSIGSFVSLPLVRNGEWRFNLSVFDSSPRNWREDEIELMRELTARIWTRLERARAEEALRRSEEDLKIANQRKDEFLAMLAHELRNPLAPIRTGLELIRLAGDTPGAVERVRSMMERQISHMVRLIDDLLDVSRITSGKIRLQPEPTPLPSLVSSAIEANRSAITSKKLELIVDLPQTLTVVDVDPTRFVQILSNLLHNATKFTDPGGSIRVSAHVTDDDEAGVGVLKLSVKDSGNGISPELLPRVFELFTQGDRASSQPGLGIGLALARRLVEMHGGYIDARSEGPGHGSEFVIQLPVSTETPKARANESIGPTRIHCRVIVIDDNRDAAAVMAMLVEELGGECRTAHDGESGIREVLSYRPQLVLLDIGMPGVDGYETCRRIRRELGKELIVVAVTGFGQEQDKERAERAGFDAHLTKPADPAAVEKVLRRCGSSAGPLNSGVQ